MQETLKMQLFTPYPTLSESVSALDSKRLFKQIVEARQIVDAVERETGWRHHPVVAAYRDSDSLSFVKAYAHTARDRWLSLGYRCSALPFELPVTVKTPPHLEYPVFCQSHRANLFRKDPSFYGRIFDDVASFTIDQPYLWPVYREGALSHFRYGTSDFLVSVAP